MARGMASRTCERIRTSLDDAGGATPKRSARLRFFSSSTGSRATTGAAAAAAFYKFNEKVSVHHTISYQIQHFPFSSQSLTFSEFCACFPFFSAFASFRFFFPPLNSPSNALIEEMDSSCNPNF